MFRILARPFVLYSLVDSSQDPEGRFSEQFAKTIIFLERRKAMKTTREKILAEGADLLSVGGFAQVTVGVLAQRAGMSKSGLFAHFGSKEEVQLDLMTKSFV